MYAVTVNPITGKLLKLPFPIEWSMDDIDFFLNRHPHLKKAEDKPTVNPIVAKPVELPITSGPEVKPEAVPVASLPNSGGISGGPCQDHPLYTGKKYSKCARECPKCKAFYYQNHPEIKNPADFVVK